jgi:hypothetical protein
MIAVMSRILHTVLALCLAAPLPACPLIEVAVLDADPGLQGAESSLARMDDGFVLTWQSRLGGNEAALRFRHLSPEGRNRASGEIARGSGWFLNGADFPSLQVLDNGDWIAHWLERTGAGRYSYDIRTTRSQDRGESWSAPVTLHDDGTASEHGFVAWVPAGEDGAWATWLDGRETVVAESRAGEGGHAHGHGAAGGAMTLRVARLSRDGVIGGELLDDRVCDCCQTAAARAGTSTLVVYRDRSDDEVRDIHLRRHDGRRWLPAQPLFAEGWRIAGCPVNGPALAARGRHAVAAAYSEAGGTPAVRLRRSSDAGASWSEAVDVVVGDTLGRLHLAVFDDGRALLSRIDTDGGDAILRLSLHGRHGEVLSQCDVARRKASQLAGFPRMAVGGQGGMLSWTEAVGGQPQVRVATLRVPADGPEAQESP